MALIKIGDRHIRTESIVNIEDYENPEEGCVARLVGGHTIKLSRAEKQELLRAMYIEAHGKFNDPRSHELK